MRFGTRRYGTTGQQYGKFLLLCPFIRTDFPIGIERTGKDLDLIRRDSLMLATEMISRALL
jgi:hypothetical protein